MIYRIKSDQEQEEVLDFYLAQEAARIELVVEDLRGNRNVLLSLNSQTGTMHRYVLGDKFRKCFEIDEMGRIVDDAEK